MRNRFFHLAFALFFVSHMVLPAFAESQHKTHSKSVHSTTVHEATLKSAPIPACCPETDEHDCGSHHGCTCHSGHFVDRNGGGEWDFPSATLAFNERIQSPPLSPELEGPFQPPRA